MKIYLKKAKYNELFYQLFDIKLFLLEGLLSFNSIGKIIYSNEYLKATYTKQSLYKFARGSHNMYIHIRIIYINKIDN